MVKKSSKYEINEKDIDTVLDIMKKSNPNATPEMAIDFLEKMQAGVHEMEHTNPEKLEELYQELIRQKRNKKN